MTESKKRVKGREKAKAQPQEISAADVRALFLEPLLMSVQLPVMTRLIGDEFAGVLGSALMLYFVFYFVFMAAGRHRVSGVVGMYYNNRFYINARDFARESLYKTLTLSLAAALLIAALGSNIAQLLTGSLRARLAFYAVIPAIVCASCGGVLLGFAKGFGSARSVRVLDNARGVLGLLLYLTGAFVGFFYGGKADAVLYTSDMAGIYAAAFGLLGLSAAQLIMLLACVFTGRRAEKRLSPLHEKGKPKFMGRKNPYFRNAWPFMLTAIFLPALLLMSGALFVSVTDAAVSGDTAVSEIGLFYGHYFAYVFVIGLLCASVFAENLSGIDGESFYALLRRQSILSFPAGAFLMALSSGIEGGVFLLKSDTAELLLTYGGFAATFISFAFTVCLLFVFFKRLFPMFVCAASAFAAGCLCLFLVTKVALLGIVGMPVALCASLIIFDCMGIYMLKSLFGIRSAQVLRMMSKPFIMSLFAALAVLVLSKMLQYLIGEIPAVILCAFIGSALYLILLSVFGGIEAGDLKSVPFGKLLERISMRGRGEE